jgi:pyridoxamine 5'-phosphate oxidase-like protein
MSGAAHAQPEPARSRSQRRIDTLTKLRSEVDLWVASADEAGRAHLVPLSCYWDGSCLTIATPRASRTAVNLLRAGRARVALGPTRDVVIIEGRVDAIETGTDTRLEDAHAQACGFDPRALPEEWIYLQITATQHPGMARGERARGPAADAQRRMARLAEKGSDDDHRKH